MARTAHVARALRRRERRPFALGLDTVSAQAPSGQRILLHVPSGTYLKLDESASAIVDLLAEHGDAERVASELAVQYAISLERATTDVTSVVTTLETLRPARTSRLRRPRIDGVVLTARQWWDLPVRIRIAVVQAAAVVVAVEMGLRTTDIATLARRMRVPLAGGLADLPADRPDDVASLAPGELRAYVAARWVLNRWIYPGTCLRRALVTGYILRRHHPLLRLGLVGDGSTSHAWVEAEGMTFNATEVTGAFVAPGHTGL
jgi:hypothetical protein